MKATCLTIYFCLSLGIESRRQPSLLCAPRHVKSQLKIILQDQFKLNQESINKVLAESF